MESPGDSRELLREALNGDPLAVRALIDVLTPVIQARVARALLRRGALRGRTVKQEVRDMTQEVFAAVFAHDGRVLRHWNVERGLSLSNFVGLVAEREVRAILRSGRRNPYSEDPTEQDRFEGDSGPRSDTEEDVASRDFLAVLLDRLEAELSPLGVQIFELSWCQERTPQEVATDLGISEESVYAWRSRIRKRAKELAEELQRIEQRAGS